MGTPFLKMNGLGNDFVVLDTRARPLALSADAARQIADRRAGVGCDQIILLESGKTGADATMRIWNADGGEVEACGNATRCIAQLLEKELNRSELAIDTIAGRLLCTVLADGRVTVDMGAPKFEWQDIPLAERMDTRNIDVKVGPIDAPVLFGPSAVNVGNPHCIFFVPDANAHDLGRIGPMLEYHPMFPKRANISLAQVRDKTHIRLRVWERGAGLTRACGTAACASVAAAARKKLTDRKVHVELDGGTLAIEWREGDGHLLMTGPAALNFRGELPIDLGAPAKQQGAT
jgi:diaminopimelate epimerase